MFLKRLEIIGFKSFAEKIEIDFVPGVTAIVGPNGSGKSNITDAIRWVLGEQSAKSLRGAKMEDVIFAGSDSRKPLNFAEVTLILDNSKGLFPLDYTEISVSRRVFRSGESVYLLNKQQCRLKDINDVFMDSGLGKESFSIISQGRVDEVLNSRPEERRNIFDEAAGVLKYRTRKKKAEHKLFETADNLDRVLDILKELETRIGPLKKNAEAAEKYAILSEETQDADITLLNYDARNQHAEIEKKMMEAKNIYEKNTELEELLEKNGAESDRFKAQLAQLDIEMDALQKKLVSSSAETEKWEGRRLLSVEKRRNAHQQVERIHSDLALAKIEQDELNLKLQDSQKRLASIQSEYETVTKEIDDVAQVLKRSVKETEKEIEQLKSVYIDRLNEEATIRNDLKHANERLVGEKTSSEKYFQQTSSLSDRFKVLTSEKMQKEQSVRKVKEQAKETELKYKQTTETVRAAEDELRGKQELLQKAFNRQHEMQGRIRALESMEADFSGFFLGVKEVLVANRDGKLTGINGAVAELINVESAYVKAIETALGGASQNIVTTSEKEARQAIAYLKSKNAGRATFLPRDVMKSRMIQPATLSLAKQHPEFVGTASSLVQTEDEYRDITENLLGNVLVATSLASATEIAKTIGYRYRVVTIDGDIVNAGGSLTGGGVKGQASVFSRKAELETLKVQLVQMASSIDSAKKIIGDMKMEIAGFMHEMEQLRHLTEVLQLEIATGESGIRETDIAIRSIESEITTSELERKGFESTGSTLLKRKKELEEQHLLVKKDLDKISAEVVMLERLAADWRQEEAILTAKIFDLRERAAVLREQRTHYKKSIDETVHTIEAVKRKITLLAEEVDYFTGNSEDGDLTSEEISERIQKTLAEKEHFETEVNNSRKKRLELVQYVDEKELLLKTLREKSAVIVSQLNKLTVEKSRLEVKYEAVTGRLLNEYGLHPDFAAVIEFDEVETRKRLSELKRKLAEIGPVNPGAVVEYAEVSERYEFLTEQRNDLLDAKSTLQEAMSEMDQEMTTRFSATFDAVQNRFRDVFKEMFGGGDADLILTNPSNLLETGVDIIARPPGKKLQNLSLLSGGERALTAIALLFSIIEVRPVPFCILDEVEAALDEANVLRYSKYLNRFSDKTQFIVITHRKGTMEGADVLYGITMQESGVSKLISVKLSEVPEEALI
ncbi:chromosome segregation protein SMC [Sporosarcina siberiensis]|uniref:Chromosome partition protein Smc n=1 Tax=Sporosarcina siberiensis TaxID=1365606 RepID=A0ABW4SI23_9BACL